MQNLASDFCNFFTVWKTFPFDWFTSLHAVLVGQIGRQTCDLSCGDPVRGWNEGLRAKVEIGVMLPPLN